MGDVNDFPQVKPGRIVTNDVHLVPMFRMHVATNNNSPHMSLCRAKGQLCLQPGLRLCWDTSFDVALGSKHKYQWSLHGSLVCTICYPCALCTSKPE